MPEYDNDQVNSMGADGYADDQFPTRVVGQYAGSGGAALARLVYVEQAAGDGTDADPSNDLMKYWRQLRSHKWTLVVMALLGVAAGLGGHLRQTPVYVARTALELNAPNEGSLVGGPRLEETGSPDALLQTQIRIMESSIVRERVDEKLRQRGIPPFEATEKLAGLRKWLRSRTSDSTSDRDLPPVEVSIRPIERSHIIEIVCESPNPNMAAIYPNALAEEYIDYHIEARGLAADRASKFLTGQLSDLRARLQESENRLQAYKQQSGLLYGSDKANVDEEKLRQLQVEFTRAEAERVSKQSAYEIASSNAAETVPEILDNGRLGGYQSELARLRREQADLMSMYTQDHPRVVRIQAQISELEQTLRRERESIISRIRNEYQGAMRREQLLAAAYKKQSDHVQDLSRKEVSFDLLRRELDSNRRIYDDLLQKSTGTAMLAAVKVSSAYVIDKARVPEIPSKPSLKIDLAMGLSGGILFGVLLVLAADQVNRKLKGPGETPLHLKVPELGVIPDSNSAYDRRKVFENSPPAGLPAGHENGNGWQHTGTQPADSMIMPNQPSRIAESFRNTVASILVSESKIGRRPRVMVVTSAARGEGKSTTVSNLGIAMAEIGQRVLLIDADLRKPDLHTVFGTSNTWGLSDLPRDNARLKTMPLEALVRPTEVKGLYLLPSGPGTISVASLLHSGRIKELIERFRREFDTILIDTPPLMYLSDARVLGRLADGAILVVRAGMTTKDMALAAKNRLVQDGISVIGTVLNRWHAKESAKDVYYGYAEQ
ncbi:MAG: polysaccharide biosynthesis tyrosine autokinase [Bryobacterales bacterium]|nr:polysaccharide biosynthesis tyrosine autokinase [Bryobacterales bacterium]